MERWYDLAEVPRHPPQICLTEVRDFNVHWVVAETSLEDQAKETGLESLTGRWVHCEAFGSVPEHAQWTQVSILGIGSNAGTTDLYIDNVRLSLIIFSFR